MQTQFSSPTNPAPGNTVTWHATAVDRLDKIVSGQFPEYSRSFLTKLINKGYASVNGSTVTKPSHAIKMNDAIAVLFQADPTPPTSVDIATITASMGIEVVYIHEHFVVLSKPAGITMHKPHPESTEVTLVDWITHNFHEISTIGPVNRPGIVHRLDKDTSGLLVIARTNYAHTVFGAMFKNRTMHKTYWALVEGHPAASGSINSPIGRHPVLRNKMSAFSTSQRVNIKPGIREALTHYQVIEHYDKHTLLELKPVTGRTHQIRVHCAALGHALVGDKTYGKQSPHIKRHALHAHKLEFVFASVPYSFTQPLPADFVQATEKIKGLL